MQQKEVAKKQTRAGMRELPILGALLGLLAMAMPASAVSFAINGTINSIISEVVLIFPSLLTLVIEMMPIIIVVSVVGFLLAFLDKMLLMLNF